MKQPLTASQLILIILVCAAAAWAIIGLLHVNDQVGHADSYADCAQHAPLGWNCDTAPTAYPR